MGVIPSRFPPQTASVITMADTKALPVQLSPVPWPVHVLTFTFVPTAGQWPVFMVITELLPAPETRGRPNNVVTDSPQILVPPMAHYISKRCF